MCLLECQANVWCKLTLCSVLIRVPPPNSCLHGVSDWPYLEIRSSQLYLVKIKSQGRGSALNPMIHVPIQRGEDAQTQEIRPWKMWRQGQSLQWCSYRPNKAEDGWEPPEAVRGKEGFFSRDFRERMALLTAWFQTTSLQYCEKINVCCFKPPNFSYFVTASLRNEYNWYYSLKLH